MIYNSLEIIPYKLFMRIFDSSEFFLLDPSKKSFDEFTEDELIHISEIWEIMYDEHISKNQTSESKKIFKISKTIDELLTTNKVVIMACASLKFEYDEDLVGIIRSYGYKLSTDNTEAYYSNLQLIEREANAYVIKSEYYKNMLPEEKEISNSDEKYTIDDVMASYCAILGISIGDFNAITYTAFKGYEKQVNAKINSLKNNKDGK